MKTNESVKRDQEIVAECWTCGSTAPAGYRAPLNQYGAALHRAEGHDVRPVKPFPTARVCEGCGKSGGVTAIARNGYWHPKCWRAQPVNPTEAPWCKVHGLERGSGRCMCKPVKVSR
jgi:hypothetical protein